MDDPGAEVSEAERAVASLVVKVVQNVESRRMPDALALISIMHPAEKRHRAVVLYVVLAASIAMLLGATHKCLFGQPTQYTLLPVAIGGTFVGAVLAAITGKPASITDMSRAARAFAASVEAPLATNGERAPSPSASEV